VVVPESKVATPGVYDKIMILIKGKQLPARPVEFIFGEDKLPSKAVRWETTDPGTGQLLQFSIDEVKWSPDGTAYFGEQPSKAVKPDAIVIVTPRPRIHVSALLNIGQVKTEAQIRGMAEVCPFRDPVEEGLFTFE
jgi:hypothetical protein